MITLSLKENNLIVHLEKCSYTTFSSAVHLLRSSRFRFDTRTQDWIAPYYKYEEIKTALEDLDIVTDNVSLEELSKIKIGAQELEVSPIRRLADYSLMNFPPMQGKHPNEFFQNNAITRGINKSRQAYFYGMGSGKSYIASAIIAHRYLKFKDCQKVVFITTSIGVRNLKHELFKFIKNLDPFKVVIADKDYRNPFDDKSKDIVIMSYNTFRLVCEFYRKQKKISSKKPKKAFLPLKEWSNNKDLMLILDESHEIAHSESQRSHLILLHANLFKYRYLFSGTPADNPEKLYAQYKVLDPWLVDNLSLGQWKEKMAYLGDRFSPYAIREWKKDELERLNQKFTASYGNYFKTEELINLPEYVEKRIYLDMHPLHRALYQQVVTQDIPSFSAVRDIVNRFPFMSLALDNPTLLEKHKEKFDDTLKKMIDTFKDSYLEKLNAIDDILEDHPNEKGVIWVVHPSTAAKLALRYSHYNPIYITGETDQKERFDLVEQFKKGDHKLLIANITCLNTSVTITEATFQIYVERTYNFATYEQSTFRIYRLGQTQNVESYILIYNQSLDVLQDKNLSSKGLLVSGLVSKDFLTQEQWQTIFNATENDNFNF